MAENVKIITDSASDLPKAKVDELSIGIVPLTIRFDDQEYVDQVELSAAEFWKKAESSDVLPSTAAPSPGAFAEAFRNAKNEGHSAVVCITLSKELSATYQAAVAGKELVGEEVDVRIVDSTTCTVGQAQVCLRAASLASTGASADEVEKATAEQASQQRLLGTLDTLEYLKKSGRIGAAGAFFAALLSVKPVITIEGGVVKPLAKQRTRSKALRYLADQVLEQQPVADVGVCHSGAPDIEDFLDLLSPVVRREDVFMTEMGPTIGVHGGPRLIAVTFSKAT